MFKKILIANRGEIACRVMRTAKRMGIATVAVHSEADAGSPHVQMADEAISVGPPPSAESYLVIDKIVAACKATGAEAVHPGYGFLSENRAFSEALKAAGIAFIGPEPHAIQAMGDKIESKKLAKQAGVSTVPGYLGAIEGADAAVEIARDIGYPVMIKASAGGGGKGMRVARTDEEVRQGFASATNEAKSSFGDDRVFIEKFVDQPRHIEIQILADSHGNCLYLGERECSIQRRHQKVIEEAPSPFLDPATRQAMGEQAVALAKAVDYRSAGTVEFIVDGSRNFYFLEMNTRLQVEHPVTEMITGLDLVEWMIRIAYGERLPIGQQHVTLTGWAMEARVYAEDPLRGFLPSIGRLTRYREPVGHVGVRVDSGVVEGSEISMFYDPMIAKLVTHGRDRTEAAERMAAALDAYVIRGVNHNIAFLTDLFLAPRFREGRMTTNYIAEEYPNGFAGVDPSPIVLRRLAAVAAIVQYLTSVRETSISGQLDGHEAVPETALTVLFGREAHPVIVTETPGHFMVEMDDGDVTVATDWRYGDVLFTGTIDDVAVTVQVERAGIGWRLIHSGLDLTAAVLTNRAAELLAHIPIREAADMSKFLLSPMPGLLISVAVAEGDEVKAGQALAVVEAMKMENVLRAERDGTVSKITASPGSNLAVDQVILEFT